MSIITLTSDFGTKDHFVGSLKGKIVSQYQEAILIDITHHVDYFNIFEARYIVESMYKNFPKNSIHIIAVNTERTNGIEHLIMQWEDHYFIAADNGILNALAEKKKPQKIGQINIHNRFDDASDLTVFAAVASHLAKGGNMNVVSKEIQNLNEFNAFNIQISNDLSELKGSIIYIDHFGNCISNITLKMFDDFVKGKNFEIRIRNKTIKRIHKSYADFKETPTKSLKEFEGDYLALFNDSGYLEIAIYNGNPSSTGSASSLLGLKFRDVISIKLIS